MKVKNKKSSGKGFSNRHKKEDQEKIGSKLNFQATEAYKLLRTNLEFSFADDKRCKIIGITSSLSGEGKSLSTINLAYSIASNDKKVMVIEGDFRKPTIHTKLGLTVKAGLTDLLVNHELKVTDILTEVKVTEKIIFDLAPAGRIPPNPSELLGSNKMKEFLQACSQAYDYILIDLPPVAVVADAVIASKYLDGMVVIVRQDQSDHKSLAETIRQLKFSNTKILGFVFNGQNQTRAGYYRRRGYKSDYNSKYAYSSKQKYAESGTSITNG